VKWHIKLDGGVGVCTASEGKCPFTTEGAQHFYDKEIAQSYAQAVIAKNMGGSFPTPAHKKAFLGEPGVQDSSLEEWNDQQDLSFTPEDPQDSETKTQKPQSPQKPNLLTRINPFLSADIKTPAPSLNPKDYTLTWRAHRSRPYSDFRNFPSKGEYFVYQNEIYQLEERLILDFHLGSSLVARKVNSKERFNINIPYGDEFRITTYPKNSN
jgi:hypothetical protein